MTLDITKLSEPFSPDRVEWRVGATNREKTKGLALAYIDARDVMDRLDEVCGPENWQRRYTHADGKTICEIGIRLGDWVWKADGAGDTDIEAEKGAISTAFKRAAVNWGIGRYLYDVEATWVAIEQKGKSYAIKESEMRRLRGERSSNGSERGFSKPAAGGSIPPAPATFWERETYHLPNTKEGKVDWSAWDKAMHNAIAKAPHLEALTKLQVDNQESIDAYRTKYDVSAKALLTRFAARMGELSQGPTE